MTHEKTVWVTGASSGLGLHTAMALRDAGWTVIAGARSFHEAREQDGIHQLPLDVTDESSIKSFVDSALEISPWVTALIHCAGILLLGSCEETTPEEFLRIMNTNFLGMVRVNSQVLPIMRAQKEGRIIMYSSINGLMGIPFQNAYTASKHAIEGYAEGLQLETRPFGIQVTLIEPGDHRGGSDQYRKHGVHMTPDSPYAGAYERTIAKIHHDESHGSDPDRLGRKVARLLEKRRMPFRRRIASPDQHLAVYLHKFLPARLNEAILRQYYIGKK